MLAFTSVIFAVGFMVYGVIGNPINEENKKYITSAIAISLTFPTEVIIFPSFTGKAGDIATDTILTYMELLFKKVIRLIGNTVISVEEFMIATKGFTKMDRNTLFEFVDRNGDMVIGVDEFKSVPQTIVSAGILDHCLRIKMFKAGCIGIGWGK